MILMIFRLLILSKIFVFNRHSFIYLKQSFINVFNCKYFFLPIIFTQAVDLVPL